MLAIRARFG